MYLLGAGGHAKVILDILKQQGAEIDGIFDDDPNIQTFSGYKVSIYDKHDLKRKELIISIGNNHTRRKIARELNFNYGTAIHPKSVISGDVSIGKGTVVMGNATINAGTTIKEHVIVNTSASIDHDCLLDDFVHIAPGAVLAGQVKVLEGSFIGAGAVIIPGIRIGKWCTIGAGAVIIRDVPDYSVVVGNPGRIIKTDIK